MLGYVGPNGASKSTTVKMLTGILVPSSGRIAVAGLEPSRQRIELARRIGVVFGQRVQLWWDLPLRDSFELLRHIYRVPEARHRRNLDGFTELLELGPFLGTPVRQLSLGQRMRGELTAAMLHDPELLFLDEPTIGLDVVAKARVREFLAEVNKVRGTTILVTSHDMDDIEALCSRVMIIDHGRLQYDGGLEELVRTTRPRKLVRATYAEPIDSAKLATLDGLTEIEGDNRVVKLEVDRERTGDLLERLSRLGPLVDLDVADADIEEIMRDLFLREAR
jgi:ABC-2 type transport system ATP-binding protein